MKYIAAFVVALIVAIIIMALNKYVLKFEIPDFLAGWLSCMAYQFTIILCETYEHKI